MLALSIGIALHLCATCCPLCRGSSARVVPDLLKSCCSSTRERYELQHPVKEHFTSKARHVVFCSVGYTFDPFSIIAGSEFVDPLDLASKPGARRPRPWKLLLHELGFSVKSSPMRTLLARSDCNGSCKEAAPADR